MKIAAITVGKRFRKHLGDLGGLAKSIETVGLLHPVVVNQNNELIAGQRRLEACKLLGWDDIPVTVVNIDSIIQAEHDENEQRLNLTVSERTAIGEAVEKELQELKKAARLKNLQKSPESPDPQNFGDRGEAAEFAAKAGGFTNPETYRQAKKVMANGTPDLKEAVDDEAVSISDAAAIVDEPPDVQTKAVKAVKAGKVKTLQKAIEQEKAGADQFDAAGMTIPSDLAAVFAIAPEFQACITQINAVSRKVDQLAETDAGKKLTPKGIRNDLNNAKNAIRFAKPYAVCPYCRTSKKKCDACKGLRWLDEQQYKLVPEDVR